MDDDRTSRLAGARTSPDGALTSAAPRAPGELPRGELVGRYLVLRPLGAGATGVVHETYDPELDRKVAVKLLHPRDDDTDRSRRARLIREARAIARLSHPNVVRVYDVGVDGERVFIAMELIAGVELGRWLAARPRSWREVCGVFVRAGRGLAAAHAAGLVHRDFKPANVLVGDDGEVRVLDFGLAHPEAAEDGDGLAALREPGVTVAGRGAGTPAYMAPEIHAERAADARADQYSFCVALYEGLCGQRPFTGRDPAALAAAKHGPPPRAGLRGLPRRLRRILLRGLAVDPERRFPDMPALLAELEADPARRIGVPVAALATLAAVGVGILATTPDRRQPCLKGQEEVAAVWSPARRAAVREALLATGMPYAGRTADTVSAALDDYTHGWKDMYESTCLATAVDRVQSEALLDLRMACLRRRLAEVDALARVFARADAGLVARAAEGVARLTPLTRCAEPAALLAHVEPPADAATTAAVEAVRRTLIEAEASERTGRYAEGLRLARDAEAAAQRAGYGPALAEARLRVGALLDDIGDYAGAATALTDAATEALASGDDLVAAQAGALATFVLGYRQSKIDGARAWQGVAAAALRRAGGDRREEALASVYWGAALERAGTFDDARAAYERALAVQQELLGADHLEVALTLNNLGTLLQSHGDLAASIDVHRRALAVRERALGPDHPEVATSRNNLGVALLASGDFAAAQAMFERALALRERVLPRGHAEITSVLANLGSVHLHRGEHEQALAAYEAALAGHPDDLITAAVLNQIGFVHLQRGEDVAAEAALRRAVAIGERVHGQGHPDLINAYNNLGRALRGQGRCGEAAALHARAQALRERQAGTAAPGWIATTLELAAARRCAGQAADARATYEQVLARLPDDEPPTRDRVLALAGLGQAELALDDRVRARQHLEQALPSASQLDPVARSELRLALAQALAAPARARALALAGQAREDLAAAGPRGQLALAAVDAWLKR